MDGKGVSGSPPRSIRIVAGSKRGHRLRVPKGPGVRPTSERVREAIFDVLGPLRGLTVLDLFAGTGALGLEALSRGARSCVFVEADPAAAATLRANISALEFDESGRVVAADYRTAVRQVRTAAGYDLLFVDPPYRMLAEVEVSVGSLIPGLLSEDGVAVIEGDRSSSVTFGETPVFDRVYGDTRVTMIRVRRSDR